MQSFAAYTNLIIIMAMKNRFDAVTLRESEVFCHSDECLPWSQIECSRNIHPFVSFHLYERQFDNVSTRNAINLALHYKLFMHNFLQYR